MNNTDEHKFKSTTAKALVISFLSLIIISTAFCNGLVLWALKRFSSLRKPGHVFLGGLAFADVCMILPLLLKITFISTRNVVVCRLQGATELVIVCCVSLHLGCISVERFVSIKFALRYDSIVTKTRVFIAIGMLWTVSFSAAFIIPLAMNSDHFEDLADAIVTVCSPKTGKRMSKMDVHFRAYAVFMLCFFFFLPCFMIVFSYTYIFIASSRQRQKIAQFVSQDESRWHAMTKRLLSDLKAARRLFIIQALFIVTYFPYFSLSLGRQEKDDDEERELFYALKSLSLLTVLTCCLNPVIYVSGNEHFKTAFKRLLRFEANHVQSHNSSNQ